MARISCDTSNSIRHTGRVKWFNVKNGYGFITPVNDTSQINCDMFVHHSAIVVGRNQYKYLTEGEYVEFDIEYTENSEHKYHATNVTGIARGLLLCETRFNNIEESKKRDMPKGQGVAPRGNRQLSQSNDDFEFPRQKISRQVTRN